VVGVGEDLDRVAEIARAPQRRRDPLAPRSDRDDLVSLSAEKEHGNAHALPERASGAC